MSNLFYYPMIQLSDFIFLTMSRFNCFFLFTKCFDNCVTVSNTRTKVLMVIEGSQVVLGSGGDDDDFLLLGLDLVHH